MAPSIEALTAYAYMNGAPDARAVAIEVWDEFAGYPIDNGGILFEQMKAAVLARITAPRARGLTP